ncbi:hypothetical protein FOZ62_028944 [Perkinsus olseni]|uniref:Uncharacterized protein n=1 Tax=Perkinsus olseni TaxID=32597 RepID=A0A7J6R2J9_PEROL|nr:hypothetical protein FOZ62_028944 [Perkinsus olseni]
MSIKQIERLHYVFRLLDTDNSAFIKLEDYVNRMQRTGKTVNTKFMSWAHKYIVCHVTEERLKAYVGFKDILHILLPNCSEASIEDLMQEHREYYRGLQELEASASATSGQPRSRSVVPGMKAKLPGLTTEPEQGAAEANLSRRRPTQGDLHHEGVEISLERLMELRRLFDIIDYNGRGVVDLRQLRGFFSDALDDLNDLDRVLVRLKGRKTLAEDASKVTFTRDDFINMILPEGLVPCAYPTPRSMKASSEQLWRCRHARVLSALQIPAALQGYHHPQDPVEVHADALDPVLDANGSPPRTAMLAAEFLILPSSDAVVTLPSSSMGCFPSAAAGARYAVPSINHDDDDVDAGSSRSSSSFQGPLRPIIVVSPVTRKAKPSLFPADRQNPLSATVTSPQSDEIAVSKWEWRKNRNEEWRPFPWAAERELETSYLTFLNSATQGALVQDFANFRMVIAGNHYRINFIDMIQYNSSTGVGRPVRRILPPVEVLADPTRRLPDGVQWEWFEVQTRDLKIVKENTAAHIEMLYRSFKDGSCSSRARIPLFDGRGDTLLVDFRWMTSMKTGGVVRPLLRTEHGSVTDPALHIEDDDDDDDDDVAAMVMQYHPWLTRARPDRRREPHADWLTEEVFFNKIFLPAMEKAGFTVTAKAGEDIFDYSYNTDFRRTRSSGRVEMRGGQRYFPPHGWKRFAVAVRGRYDSGDNSWLGLANTDGREWAVAYHGTSAANLPGILARGIRPGTRQNYSQEVGITQGIYCSPHPDTAGVYSDTIMVEGRRVGVMLQCRVRPAAVRQCQSRQDYWVIESSEDVRPYGVLVRELSDDSDG